jgi:hypothetical protein
MESFIKGETLILRGRASAIMHTCNTLVVIAKAVRDADSQRLSGDNGKDRDYNDRWRRSLLKCSFR